MKTNGADTTIHTLPHAFVDKRGVPFLVTTLDRSRQRQLINMYLAYRPRYSFSGLPPIENEACVRWVRGLIATGINLIATSAGRQTDPSQVPDLDPMYPCDIRLTAAAAACKYHSRFGLWDVLQRAEAVSRPLSYRSGRKGDRSNLPPTAHGVLRRNRTCARWWCLPRRDRSGTIRA